MAKIKTAFFCKECGYENTKWAGRCPSCGQWNSFVEEVISKSDEKSSRQERTWKETRAGTVKTIRLEDVDANDQPRIKTEDPELDRVLGGGIVPGSLVLVAGDPGIGKSTLFLQMGLALKNKRVLYVSGEESAQQIKLRASRLSQMESEFFLLTETQTRVIFSEIKKMQPDLLIIDSIQTLESEYIDSAAGSISQIRETASELLRFAKETATPVILIGHITKDGSIAGPKILEHMVDVVLQFEGDRNHVYRLLRTIKNRFGSTAELGIYEMTTEGMRVVSNPSEILLSQRAENLSGSVVAACMEGQRPLLIEVQALVTQSVYGTPQRTASGFDMRRLQVLLAVLEKRSGFQFGMKDVFVNLAGGLRVEDPSLDLAVVMAMLSSYEDIPVSPLTCFAAEVGLNGEVRAVNRIEQRIQEAERLGFEKIIISSFHKKLSMPKFIEVVKAGNVGEALGTVFG